jgi:pimeloyl-ACP methyl ester carboxylesterase
MNNETVVLLHCSGSSGAQWRALAAELGTRYRVFTPDLLGYGANAGWTAHGRFTLAREAAPIHEILDREDGPVHLVGHSYGGAVALHIARARPGQLRSLALIEPTAFHLLRDGDSTDAAALGEITAVAEQAKADLADDELLAGFGRFVDYWSGPGSWSAMPAERRAGLAPQLVKIALDFEALLGEPATLADVRRIATPALLLQGALTTPAARRVCRLLRDALPAMPFFAVPGAGHMLPITHRDPVNRLLAAHIDSYAAPRRKAA